MSAEIKTFTPASQQKTHKVLGQIFIERGLLTEISVNRLVEHAKSKKMRLGELLEALGLVTPEELAEALTIQYQCKKIMDFARYSFPEGMLRVIPLDMAVKNTIFPLKLEDGKLGLAVADPTMEELFAEISRQHNVKIILFVSTRTEINRAIARHYLGQSIAESRSKSILVVEDDKLVRESVEKILKRQGYEVATAMDGMDAFSKIFTLKPQLVITDKVMPKLSGYEFLYAIRKIPEFRYMPVILMTAAATPDEEKDALEKGFFDFILKPVKEIGLLTRVQRAVQSGESLYGKTA